MEFLTIEDVMKIFHKKDRKTIDNWLYTGVLPRSLTIKMGRSVFFDKAKLENFLKQKSCSEL